MTPAKPNARSAAERNWNNRSPFSKQRHHERVKTDPQVFKYPLCEKLGSGFVNSVLIGRLFFDIFFYGS